MKPTLSPIEQDPRHLTLALLEPSAALPAMRVLTARTIQYENWTLTCRIIGESHWITIGQPGRPVLHEVLACISIDPHRCQHHHTLANAASHSYAMDTRYQVVTASSALQPAPMWDIPRNAIALEQIFPVVNGIAPVTRIQVARRNDVLHWWTLHVYATADEPVGIRTHSQWQLVSLPSSAAK